MQQTSLKTNCSTHPWRSFSGISPTSDSDLFCLEHFPLGVQDVYLSNSIQSNIRELKKQDSQVPVLAQP